MLDLIELFSCLTQEEKNTLSLFCQKRFLKSWEILFEEWQEANSMYILESGLLEIYNSNGLLKNLKPQELVWEMWFFSNSNKRMATVKATQDSYLVVILYFSLEELMKTHTPLYNKIHQIIQERNKENSNIK